MLADVVVDTNVLVRANNAADSYFDEASEFLETLAYDCETALCLDSGFDYDEAKNRSLIFAEYRESLSPATLSAPILASLFVAGRVISVETRLPDAQRRCVNRLIDASKPRDRTFLKVAINSAERVLVSHDFEDFDAATRVEIARHFDVDVIEAETCRPRLD
jgi:hypothetical protein